MSAEIISIIHKIDELRRKLLELAFLLEENELILHLLWEDQSYRRS